MLQFIRITWEACLNADSGILIPRDYNSVGMDWSSKIWIFNKHSQDILIHKVLG